jgi:hypothetical protein
MSTSHDVLRRACVLPQDLYASIEFLARVDGWMSVQAFIVCELQKLATARQAELPPNGTTYLARRKQDLAPTT